MERKNPYRGCGLIRCCQLTGYVYNKTLNLCYFIFFLKKNILLCIKQGTGFFLIDITVQHVRFVVGKIQWILGLIISAIPSSCKWDSCIMMWMEVDKGLLQHEFCFSAYFVYIKRYSFLPIANKIQL